MYKIILTTAALLATATTQAQINPIARESGFSGSLTAGAVYGEIASNFYKSDEHERIDNLGSPQGQSIVSPMIRFDLRYTLAESRTQFVLGNQIHDALRFDFTQLLGVRQEITGRGILSAGFVFNGIAPNEVWADPYRTNATRAGTERDTKGLRLGWESIMGSAFSVDLTSRRIDIENEDSGRSTTLAANQLAQLDRNGTSTRLRLSYDWEFAPRHFLSPGLIIGKDDLDGAAMRNDSTGFKLDYGFNTGNDTLAASLFIGQQNYDAGHPLFGNRKADSTDYALGVNYLRQGLFGYKWLGGYVNASYGKSESNIDFFNADFKRLGFGLRYKF